MRYVRYRRASSNIRYGTVCASARARRGVIRAELGALDFTHFMWPSCSLRPSVSAAGRPQSPHGVPSRSCLPLEPQKGRV